MLLLPPVDLVSAKRSVWVLRLVGGTNGALLLSPACVHAASGE